MIEEPTDILEEAVSVPAGDGVLAGVLAYPFAAGPEGSALVVGPHPMMGGRVDNNVVRAVGRGLAEHGFTSLRFEFGGEGPSAETMESFWETGHAPDDAGRGRDVLAAFDWLEGIHGAPIVAVGYSFGASLLSELVIARPVSHVALVGATFAQHDYKALAASGVPKLLIAADNDFATPIETTRAWFRRAAGPKRLVVVPAAEHFYLGQEERIVREVLSWIRG